MMALKKKERAAPVARTVDLPAPILGWNAKDGWSVMDPRYAIQLDNFFPESDSVILRSGYEQHATDFGGKVTTLHAYEVGATKKLLAADEDTLWECSAAAAATSLATGLSNGLWSAVTFNDYAILVNGEDTPRKYGPSASPSLSTTAFTGSGLTATNLIGVAVYANRLYLWEDNAQAFWYGGVNAISGALTKFDFSGLADLRGKLVAVAPITFDAGDGVNDALAFLFSGGQVFIYQGTNPGDSSNWSKVGVFQIADPLSRRGVFKYGGDVMVMTKQGYFQLSRAITLGNVSDSVSLSDKINPALRTAYESNPNFQYWQGLLYSKRGMLIFNTPSLDAATGQDAFYQHVMNTTTGAWCRFTNWDGYSFTVFDGDLYFGGNTVVNKADTGTADGDEDIDGSARTAFSTMGHPGIKRWTMARPIFEIDGEIPLSIGMAVDYGVTPGFSAASSTVGAGPTWASSGDPDANLGWDLEDWGPGRQIQKNWQSITGIGHVGSLQLKISTQTQVCKWYSTTFVFEHGAIL
jgi:hypothetical protein